MGERNTFKKEKLIFGILLSEEIKEEEVFSRLIQEFGPIDYVSSCFPFNYTSYYNDEMGDSIRRYFVSITEPIFPETLSAIKIQTNLIEEDYQTEKGRRVNLDPGLLDLGRLVLATTKNRSHRIPLNQGIYGEVTLMYRKGGYKELPWTYPDFASKDYDPVLLSIRKIYKDQLL